MNEGLGQEPQEGRTMRLVINHDTCRHSGEFADRCLAASLRNPYGHERYCGAEFVEDGKAEVAVTLIMGGKAYQKVFRSEAERGMAADRGWLAFLDADLSAART
jgi:hypothetical protein